MVEFLKSLSSCSSLEGHNLKMHMQTHMSGQIPNQADPQLSGLPLQNGNSMPPIQNLVGLRNTSSMDLDLEMKRKYLRDQIYQKLVQWHQKLVQRRPQMTPDMLPNMKDIVKRLEECLFKSATSKEEYMNMDTLDQRLHTLIRRLPAANHSQQLLHHPSSSSTSTIIPTPGISHSGNMNLSVTYSLDTSMNATSGYNAFVANTLNIGNPNANVSSVGRYGGFFSTSDGSLPNGYQQSPSHVSMGSGGNKLPSVFTPEKMDARKNFLNRCHDVEQIIEERERHPINSRDKHALYPVEVRDVAADTKDRDEILLSEFFDTKHSSMMFLYHLHIPSPTAPALVTTCNVCHNYVETGQGWRCEICADYDVCNACFHKDGGVDHPHKLTNHPFTADRDAQNKEGRQKRVAQLKEMFDLLVHASQCCFPQCPYPNCRRVKGLFRHGQQCITRASGGCVPCKKMWFIIQLHARACKGSECHVPRCRDMKEHVQSNLILGGELH